MTSLDFEGEYGRTYARTIRHSIPAYDALLDIAAATLAANAASATTALVVGPGLGEELPGMLSALPEARFTLLEPSEQMARGCAAVIAREDAGDRCRLLGQLTARVAPGGLLLLSSYSEPAEAEACARMLAIGESRLRQLGMAEDTLRQFMAARNTLVFSLDQALLAEELTAGGLEPPQPLLQALGSRMWLSRRG